MTNIRRTPLLLLTLWLVLSATPAQAQYWRVCGPWFPCIFTEVFYPPGSDSIDTAATLRQADFHIVGWSVNWYTGQQPVSIWAEARRQNGQIVPLNVGCPPEACVHWRLPFPQAAALFQARWQWPISQDTAFQIYFVTPPPLDTERVMVYTKDPWGPATVTYVFVHLVE